MTPARSRGRSVGSFRWWFEDRRTGEIVIGQLPNWSIIGAAMAFVVRVLATDGSTLHDVASVAFTALLVVWAADELVRGVNPWRRVLGAFVLASQVISLL